MASPPTGALPAGSSGPASVVDAIRMRAWMDKAQHPSDCTRAVGTYHKQQYFWGLGFGAQMVSLKHGLLHALLEGRVYHFPTSHYVNPLRCPSRSFDCYFEAPTHCPLTAHRKIRFSQIHWCSHIPREELSFRANLSAVYPAAWYHAQLAAFLFRPNSQMRTFMRRLAASLEVSDPTSNTSVVIALAARVLLPKKRDLASTTGAKGGFAGRGTAPKKRERDGGGRPFAPKRRPGHNNDAVVRDRGGRHLAEAGAVSFGNESSTRGLGRCVAVHIRRTDKFTTHRREDHLAVKGFSEYAQMLKSWAYWEGEGPVVAPQVLLGSEDKRTFTQFPPLVSPWLSYWVPPSAFVMDMTPGKAFVGINQGNQRLGELYAAAEARNRAREREGKDASPAGLATAAAAGDKEAALLLKDEGMVLGAQMLLMGECDAMAGSFASNVAVLVHDLMLGRWRGDATRIRVLDVNGRVYCGCGASFCMTLERKAIRDPTRTIETLVRASPG